MSMKNMSEQLNMINNEKEDYEEQLNTKEFETKQMEEDLKNLLNYK